MLAMPFGNLALMGDHSCASVSLSHRASYITSMLTDVVESDS